jgi:hypothetical protein
VLDERTDSRIGPSTLVGMTDSAESRNDAGRCQSSMRMTPAIVIRTLRSGYLPVAGLAARSGNGRRPGCDSPYVPANAMWKKGDNIAARDRSAMPCSGSLMIVRVLSVTGPSKSAPTLAYTDNSRAQETLKEDTQCVQ